jgi:hypothetical protein
MEPISIALGLAQFVPGIIRWISGDDKSKTAAAAEQIVGIAQQLTGTSSGPDALAAIQANPELALKFQQATLSFELGMYQEETKRLAEINTTMRAEIASADAFVRRMRPTWGYCMALTWVVQMIAISYVIVADPGNAGGVISGVGDLSLIWSVGLSVLGIYQYRRSTEKVCAKTGVAPASALNTLAKRITGKG